MDKSYILNSLNSGTLADVLDSLDIRGVLPHIITPKNKNRKIFSQIYTVRWVPTRKSNSITELQPSTWSQVENFIIPELEKGEGLVYVASSDDGLLTDYALAGGFSCEHLQNLGFEGAIFYGGIRDAHAVNKLSMPILATNYIPSDTQGNYKVLETGTFCIIDNIIINTGDWLFSDDTGIVIIPNEKIDLVIQKSLEIENTEKLISLDLRAGKSLVDIVRIHSRL